SPHQPKSPSSRISAPIIGAARTSRRRSSIVRAHSMPRELTSRSGCSISRLTVTMVEWRRLSVSKRPPKHHSRDGIHAGFESRSGTFDNSDTSDYASNYQPQPRGTHHVLHHRSHGRPHVRLPLRRNESRPGISAERGMGRWTHTTCHAWRRRGYAPEECVPGG